MSNTEKFKMGRKEKPTQTKTHKQSPSQKKPKPNLKQTDPNYYTKPFVNSLISLIEICPRKMLDPAVTHILYAQFPLFRSFTKEGKYLCLISAY